MLTYYLLFDKFYKYDSHGSMQESFTVASRIFVLSYTLDSKMGGVRKKMRADSENAERYLKYAYSGGEAWIRHLELTKLRTPGKFLDIANIHFHIGYLENVLDIKCPETIQIFEPQFVSHMRNPNFSPRDTMYIIRWEAELLIIKMLENSHAFIFVIDLKKWTLYIIDSLVEDRFYLESLETVRKYMERENWTKNKSNKKLSVIILTVDQQEKGSNDCILHVGGYLEYIIRDSPDGFRKRVTKNEKTFYSNKYVKTRQEVLDLLLQEKTKLMTQEGDGDKNDNTIEIDDDEVLKRKQSIKTVDDRPKIELKDGKREFRNPKKHAKTILNNKLKKKASAPQDSLRKGMLFQCKLCSLHGKKGDLHTSVYQNSLMEHDVNWLNKDNLFYIENLKKHVQKHGEYTSESYKEEFGDPVEPDLSYFHKCHICQKEIELTNDKIKNHVLKHGWKSGAYIEAHCYPMKGKKKVSYKKKKISKCEQCLELFDKVKDNFYSK